MSNYTPHYKVHKYTPLIEDPFSWLHTLVHNHPFPPFCLASMTAPLVIVLVPLVAAKIIAVAVPFLVDGVHAPFSVSDDPCAPSFVPLLSTQDHRKVSAPAVC
jgi:hypothetical protein